MFVFSKCPTCMNACLLPSCSFHRMMHWRSALSFNIRRILREMLLNCCILVPVLSCVFNSGQLVRQRSAGSAILAPSVHSRFSATVNAQATVSKVVCVNLKHHLRYAVSFLFVVITVTSALSGGQNNKITCSMIALCLRFSWGLIDKVVTVIELRARLFFEKIFNFEVNDTISIFVRL